MDVSGSSKITVKELDKNFRCKPPSQDQYTAAIVHVNNRSTVFCISARSPSRNNHQSWRIPVTTRKITFFCLSDSYWSSPSTATGGNWTLTKKENFHKWNAPMLEIRWMHLVSLQILDLRRVNHPPPALLFFQGFRRVKTPHHHFPTWGVNNPPGMNWDPNCPKSTPNSEHHSWQSKANPPELQEIRPN